MTIKTSDAISVKTPELALASSALSDLLKAANEGTADLPQGKIVIGAANGMCRVVKTDLDRRLAAGRLAAIEAKTIDATKQKQIAA